MISIRYGLILLALSGAAAAAGQSAPTAAGQERELLVTNRGARPVVELHVSSSQTDDWGGDRLGGVGLKPGQSVRVRLGRGRDCRFDVIASYPDGRQEEADNLDVCNDHRLAFDGSTAQGPAVADGQGTAHQVTVTDRTPLDIVELYMSAAAAPQWGDDRLTDATLADGTLPSGQTTTLTYRGGCQVDLRVVFENKAAEERRDLNICARPAVTIAPGWTTQEGDAAPAPEAGLTLRNRSGHTIAELYAYPDGADARGPDLLAGRAARDGETIALGMVSGHICRGTLRAVLADHQGEILRSGVDLCTTRELALDGGPGASTAAR